MAVFVFRTKKISVCSLVCIFPWHILSLNFFSKKEGQGEPWNHFLKITNLSNNNIKPIPRSPSILFFYNIYISSPTPNQFVQCFNENYIFIIKEYRKSIPDHIFDCFTFNMKTLNEIIYSEVRKIYAIKFFQKALRTLIS